MWLGGELWRRSLIWLNLPGRNAAKNVTPIHRNTADRIAARASYRFGSLDSRTGVAACG